MGPDGPIKGAIEDAIREFERLSRLRHEADPGAIPLYRVVAGQHASRNQVEDPTRFLVSVAGGMPPDVIFFDRFAISEWAARGAFTPLDESLGRDLTHGSVAAGLAGESVGARRRGPARCEEPPRAKGASPLAAVEPIRQDDFFPACWDEAVYRNPLTGEQRGCTASRTTRTTACCSTTRTSSSATATPTSWARRSRRARGRSWSRWPSR